MSEFHLRFTSRISGPPERVFELVADMPNYQRWLPESSAFGGTVDVTPYPVRLGTTYLDARPIEKPGLVTEFEPPRHIGFHHIVKVRQGPMRTDVDARIRYSFNPTEDGTSVLRELDLTFNLSGVLKLTLPFLLWGFKKENVRTLAQLKRYVETQAS
jgi:uncharacterized protein YndB with AHSA1/START domain